MFKSIVVGLDGSDQSKHALGFAAGLAREAGAKLIVAHVEEDIVGKGADRSTQPKTRFRRRSNTRPRSSRLRGSRRV